MIHDNELTPAAQLIINICHMNGTTEPGTSEITLRNYVNTKITEELNMLLASGVYDEERNLHISDHIILDRINKLKR